MKKLLPMWFLLISFSALPQSAGAFIGGGLIAGNSPSISSAASSLFFETAPVFGTTTSLRFSFLYNTDLNTVLPSTTNRYNSFIKGFSIKGVSAQTNKNFYIEESIGLLMLNDRIFSDESAIDFGFVISVGAGFDLRDGNPKGFKIGAGTDYGFTFTNTYAKYFALYLQGQYYF